MSAQPVQAWLSGKQAIRREHLHAVARVLDLSRADVGWLALAPVKP